MDSASQWTKGNAVDVLQTKLSHPLVAQDILDLPVKVFADMISSDELMVEKEEDTYFAVLDWVRHDSVDRKDCLQGLLKLLRYGSLSTDFIQEQLAKETLLKGCHKCSAVLREQMSTVHEHKTERQSTKDVPVIVGLQNDKAFCHDMESGTTYKIMPPVELFMSCPFDLNAAVEQNTIFAISSGQATRYPFVKCQLGVGGHQGVVSESWHCLPWGKLKRDICCLVALKGLVYAIGGDYSGAVECFDPKTNQWEQVASLQKPCHCTIFAVASDCNIFVIESRTKSGADFNECTVEKYDPIEDTWELVAPMPRHNAVETCPGVVFDAVVVQEKIFALEDHSSLCKVYDLNLDTWVTIAAHHETPTCGVDKLLNIDNVLYAFEMDNTRNVQTKASRFDQETNNWQNVELFGPKHLDCFTLFGMKVKTFYLKSLTVAPADFIPSLFVPRK